MAAGCAVAKARLAQAVNGLKEYPLSDRFVAGVKLGYLATATSRMKHVLSLATTMGYRGLVEQPVRVAADYIQAIGKAALDNNVGEFQKYRTTTNLINARAISGIARAGVVGLKDAMTAIRTGVDPERVGDVFDVGQVQLKNPLLRAIQNRVNTLVSASNKPFFDMALQASLLDQAQALSKISGQPVDYHLGNISDEMAQRGLDEATHAIFGEKGPASQGLAMFKLGLRQVRDKAPTLTPIKRATLQAAMEGLQGDEAVDRAHQLMSLPGSRFESEVSVPSKVPESLASRVNRAGAGALLVGTELLLPFARIGLNLGEAGLEMTPLGVPYSLVKALYTKDGRVLVDGLIKSTAGTSSLVALGYYLRQQGVLTGAAPSSPGERNRERIEGIQPYSVNMGNTSRRYDWVEPISFPIALGADLADQIKQTPDDEAGALVRAEGQNFKMLTMKGILGSFAQVGSAASGDARAAVRYITGLLSPPPIVGQIAKGTDTVRDRDTRSTSTVGQIENVLKAKIPGFRETLPARVNAFGDTSPQVGGMLDALLDPSNPSRITPSPETDELARLGVGVPDFGSRLAIRGQPPITRTPQQLDAMSQEFGAVKRAALLQLMSDPEFQAASDAEKRAAIERALRAVTRGANTVDKARRAGEAIPFRSPDEWLRQ